MLQESLYFFHLMWAGKVLFVMSGPQVYSFIEQLHTLFGENESPFQKKKTNIVFFWEVSEITAIRNENVIM